MALFVGLSDVVSYNKEELIYSTFFAYMAAVIIVMGKIDVAFTKLTALTIILIYLLIPFIPAWLRDFLFNHPGGSLIFLSVIFGLIILLIAFGNKLKYMLKIPLFLDKIFEFVSKISKTKEANIYFFLGFLIVSFLAFILYENFSNEYISGWKAVVLLSTVVIILFCYYFIIYKDYNSLLFSIILFIVVDFSIKYFIVGNEFKRLGGLIELSSDGIQLSKKGAEFSFWEIIGIIVFPAFVFFLAHFSRLYEEMKYFRDLSEKSIDVISTALSTINKLLKPIDRLVLYLQAIGSNKNMAMNFGIEIKKYTFLGYFLMFALVILLSFIEVFYSGMRITSDTFNGENLLAIFLAVLAGTRLEGGQLYLHRIPFVVFSVIILISWLNRELEIDTNLSKFFIYTFLGVIVFSLEWLSKRKK